MTDHLTEARLLARTLTPRKLANYARLWASYHLATRRGRPIHWGNPAVIGVEPTTACNLRCPECVSGQRAFTRPTGRLKPGLFDRLLDQTAPDLLYLLLYFQGEPYLNPDFLTLAEAAARRRIFTMTSTNGHFLDDLTAKHTVQSGLHKLIISIDGLDQATYQTYRRGGDLATVLRGLETLLHWKHRLASATPFVEVQFIVFGHNEHQLAEVQKLRTRYPGIDRVRLKTAQVYDYTQGSPLIPRHSPLRRYEPQPDGTYAIRNPLPNRCWKLWQGFEMTWDGRVVPCCFDKNADHLMGQFPDTPIDQIWRSEAYTRFRAQLLTHRATIDMCRNCTEGLKLHFLDTVG
jgi:radical SAM protein with 4Fe4S-binding SPASM domain